MKTNIKKSKDFNLNKNKFLFNQYSGNDKRKNSINFPRNQFLCSVMRRIASPPKKRKAKKEEDNEESENKRKKSKKRKEKMKKVKNLMKKAKMNQMKKKIKKT